MAWPVNAVDITVRARTPGTTYPSRSAVGSVVARVSPAPSSTSSGTPMASTTASPRRAVSRSSILTCRASTVRKAARPGAGVNVPLTGPPPGCGPALRSPGHLAGPGQRQVDVLERAPPGVDGRDVRPGGGEEAQRRGHRRRVEPAGDRVLARWVFGDRGVGQPGLQGSGGEAGVRAYPEEVDAGRGGELGRG